MEGREGPRARAVGSPGDPVGIRRALFAVLVVLSWAAVTPGMAFAAGGSISGRVTEASSHTPIQGIRVCASVTSPGLEEEEQSTGEFGCATTNAAGEYTVSGLNAGTFEVFFYVPPGSPLNFIAQFYDSKEPGAEPTPVTVVEGTGTPNINAELESGAELSGTVTSSVTGAGLEDAEICAVRAISPTQGEAVACTVSGVGGKYTLTGVPPGALDVAFLYFEHEELGIEFYGGGKKLDEAKPITVAAKEVRTGLDEVLALVHFSPEENQPGGEEHSSTMGPGGGLIGNPTTTTTVHGLSLFARRVAVVGGVALVKVRCSGSVTCHGRLALRERRLAGHAHERRAGLVSLGAAEYTVKAGGLAAVKIRLDAVGRAYLRRDRGRFSFHIAIEQSSPGPESVLVKDVTLVAFPKGLTKR
jgi:hypothetical protein